jgi:hypothetical protein
LPPQDNILHEFPQIKSPLCFRKIPPKLGQSEGGDQALQISGGQLIQLLAQLGNILLQLIASPAEGVLI